MLLVALLYAFAVHWRSVHWRTLYSGGSVGECCRSRCCRSRCCWSRYCLASCCRLVCSRAVIVVLHVWFFSVSLLVFLHLALLILRVCYFGGCLCGRSRW